MVTFYFVFLGQINDGSYLRNVCLVNMSTENQEASDTHYILQSQSPFSVRSSHWHHWWQNPMNFIIRQQHMHMGEG